MAVGRDNEVERGKAGKRRARGSVFRHCRRADGDRAQTRRLQEPCTSGRLDRGPDDTMRCADADGVVIVVVHVAEPVLWYVGMDG